ncbi:MAG TPA: SGNH/GDSL hydrolase family protein [Candidatus Polarisedimenticolaceae bacterium]|nr:SGNH/GDSL hydrolase family protein [Candidatus Polarisedimenticolaceae bacterium]
MVADALAPAVDVRFWYAKNMRVLLIVAGLIFGLVFFLFLILGIQVWLAMRNRPPAYTNPAVNPQRFGQSGPVLRYVVLGDSTAAGQGTAYADGIAVGSGKHLGAKNQVELTNLAISGAKAADVERKQLAQAEKLKPDLVLISVGANDVVSRTNPGEVAASLRRITGRLAAANCNVKIVLTGSAEMGAIPRFAQPLRTVAGRQTGYLNSRLYPWITAAGYTLAPIAADTGAAFKRDSALFGDDRFHPSAKGYALWLKTINPALDRALAYQQSHCKTATRL